MSCGSSGGVNTEEVRYEALDSVLLNKYDFVNLTADTIVDPNASLEPFYASLARIKQVGASDMPCVVSIVHYGDSHIQGGVLSETIMRHFAHYYGTAGRGFITPHKLSGKNEPRDYAISSSSAHRSLQLYERGDELSRGVSGVSVWAAPGARYTLRVLELPEDKADYRFSRVVVFHDSLSPIIEAAHSELLDESGGDDVFRSYTTLINLLSPTDSVSLVTFSDPPFSNGPIYGFSLENDRSGVIYHSIGVNGACYTHWGRYPQIARQSEALAPQLIIISLGSNEASGHNFIESVFYNEIDSFVSKLKQANPQASILLTSPPQAMRKVRGGRKVNTNFELVSATLERYARENSLAFFDLYRVTGGDGSALKWLSNGMQSRDGLHFTPEGYRLQGLLIYRALQQKMH